MSDRDYAILSDEAYEKPFPDKLNNGYQKAQDIDYEYVMSSGKGNDFQGYYGVAFKKGDEVVIVHRGTELNASFKSDLDEAIAYFREKEPDQYKRAAKFTDKVRAEFGDSVRYVYSGHSAGAGYAEMLSIRDNTKAVVFESPGTYNIASQKFGSDRLQDNRITSYASLPNFINTLNKQISIPIQLAASTSLHGSTYWSHTRASHGIKNLATYFDDRTGMPKQTYKVDIWPIGLKAGWDEYSKHHSSCSSSHESEKAFFNNEENTDKKYRFSEYESRSDDDDDDNHHQDDLNFKDRWKSDYTKDQNNWFDFGPRNNTFQSDNFFQKWKDISKNSHDKAETIQAMHDMDYMSRNPYLMSFHFNDPYFKSGLNKYNNYFGDNHFNDAFYDLRWNDPMRIGRPYRNQLNKNQDYVSNRDVIREAIDKLFKSDSLTSLYDAVKSELSLDLIKLSFSEFKGILSASRSFATALVETKLISSYNMYHLDSSFQSLLRGFLGKIGGVATKPGIIQNLIDSPQQVLDDDVILAIKNPQNSSIFSDQELKDIYATLFEGIYKYNTYPFFSLHFNNDGALYPIIHPIYQNTIVGEVIGYLDYYMKGYLNGGIYSKETLENWHNEKNTDREYLKKYLIDIKQLSQEQGLPYMSLREMMYIVGLDTKDESHSLSVGSDSQKYMTSFRIISKLKDVEYKDNVILMEPDFDVEYTIDLNPQYKEFIESVYKVNNTYPEDYKQLNRVYATAANNVKTQMPNFSFAKELFAKLNVINSISYYFSTLKEMGRVPTVEVPSIRLNKSFPKVLPPIPVRYYEKYKINVTLGNVLDKLTAIESTGDPKDTLNNFLSKYYESNELELPQIIINRVELAFKNAIKEQINDKIPDSNFLKDNTKAVLELFLSLIINGDNEDKYEFFIKSIEHYTSDVSENFHSKFDRIEFDSLKEFDEKLDFLREHLDEAHGKMKQYLTSVYDEARRESTKIDDDIKKRITDVLSQTLRDAIADLAQEVQSEFNAQHYDGIFNYYEKIAYYENSINNVCNKALNRYAKDGVESLRTDLFKDLNNKKQQQQDLSSKNRMIDSENHTSRVNRLQKFIDSQLEALDQIKATKYNFTSTVDTEVSILTSYKHPMIDISDGVYLKTVGTDLRIMGGVGLKLEDVKAKDLKTSTAIKIKSIVKESSLKFAQLSDQGNNYSIFKITSKPQAMYSNLESISNDNDLKAKEVKSNPKSSKVDIHKIVSSKNHQQLDNITTEIKFLVEAKDDKGYTSLLIAAEIGDIEAVKILVLKQADINCKLPNGLSALSVAIINGHEEVAQYLIGLKNIDINVDNNTKNTPLHYAIELKLTNVAKNLIARGAKLDIARLEDGYYPLHVAACIGNKEVIETIKNVKFDMNTPIASGKTALHIATLSQDINTIKLLIKLGCNSSLKDSKGNTALVDALEKGYIDVAYHLSDITDIKLTNNLGQTALLIAAKFNQFNIAHKLIERGESPLVKDLEGHNYIFYLIMKGEFLRYIDLHKKLNFDINMSFEEGSSLFLAAKNGHDVLTNYLIENGAEYESKYDKLGLLSTSVKTDNVDYLIKYFNEEGFLQRLTNPINKIDLLYIAVENGSYKCFGQLITKYFKDSNLEDFSKTNDREHILICAVKSGHKFVFSRLLKMSKSEVIDNNGNNLGHLAVDYGHKKLLKVLHENGINFKAQNNQGLSSYHIAVKNDNKDLLKELFEINDKENWPKDLYSFAVINKSDECISYLKDEKYLDQQYTAKSDVSKLNKACENGNLSQVKELLKIYSSEKLEEPLHKAVINGHLGIVELLLTHQADPKVKVNGYSAYYWAIKNQHLDIIKLLNHDDLFGRVAKEKYLQLTDNSYVKAAILKQYDITDKAALKLYQALEKSNFTAIKLILKTFPVKSVLIKGNESFKPFIHHLFDKKDFLSNLLIKKVLASFYDKFNPLVKDIYDNGLISTILNHDLKDITFKIQLINKYFPDQFLSLLNQTNKDGIKVIDSSVKHEESLFSVLINNDLVDIKNIDSQTLYKVIVNGNKEMISACLDKITDVDIQDQDNVTLLMIAAQSNHLDVVKELIKKGADVDMINKDHNQALHIAISSKNIEIALYLASITSDLSFANKEGYTPLMLAAQNNLPVLVEYLVSQDFDKYHFNNNGYNALHLAALQGYTEVVIKLIKNGFDVNRGSIQVDEGKQYNITPLHLSMLNGKEQATIILIQNGALLEKEDSNGNNAFQYAVRCDEDHMGYFIKTLKGFYNEENQVKMMVSAVLNDNINIVRELYLRGNSLDITHKNNLNLLHVASQYNSKKVLKFLFEQGMCVNLLTNTGKTALHLAAKEGNTNIISQLIRYKADINVSDNDGKTPLYITVEKKKYASTIELLKAKADFNKSDHNGVTPAQLALRNDDIQTAKLLFILGDTSLTNNINHTTSNHVLKLIQKNKSLISGLQKLNEVAIKDHQNNLFLAVRLNHIEGVKIILNNNPQYLDVEDYRGRTAIEYADKEMKILLQSYNSINVYSNEQVVIPVTPKLISKQDLALRLKNILLEKLDDQELVSSVVEDLKILSYSSTEQFMLGFRDADIKANYILKCQQLLSIIKDDKKLILDIENSFLRPYRWNFLFKTDLIKLIDSVKNIDNTNLNKWFVNFFTPIQVPSANNKLAEAISEFKSFIANFNKNLSDAPLTNISFETGGIEYIKRVNWVINYSKNKDLQSSFLNKLPSAESIECIKDNNLQVMNFVTSEMFFNHKLLHMNIDKIYDYSALKTMLLRLSSDTKEIYDQALTFFDKLEETNFTNQERIFLSKTFNAYKQNDSNINLYVNAALELKNQIGEIVLHQIYGNNSSKIQLEDYSLISQLIIVLKDKVNFQDIVKKYTSLSNLKNYLQTQYDKNLDNTAKNDVDINAITKKFDSVKNPILKDELEKLISSYKEISDYTKTFQKMSLLELVDEANNQAKLVVENSQKDASLKLITILCEGIYHKFGIHPYETQVITALALLNEEQNFKGKIAEVLTGEGKSTIITVLSAYLALTGHNVDIITSSQDLAIRDQKKYSDFYKLFNIKSSHICYQDPDVKHFNAKVLFGTNHDFEFAILRSRINDKKLFIKDTRTVIVDEVDNLFIDTALNSARIAYPALKNVNWIYEPVLKYVKDHSFISTSKLKEYLKLYNPKEFSNVEAHLNNEYLTTLVNSAKNALEKKLNYDYVVKFDPQSGKLNVIIVDLHNTGKLNYGSRWSAGIHEFLEVINGLEPESESLTVASISHPSFFNLYSKIYGLTGTIGDSYERKEVQTIYNVNFFDVPSHFDRKEKVVLKRLIDNPKEYYEYLIASIKSKIDEGKPVLALFQSIKENESFSKMLKLKNVTHNVLNEVQEAHKEYILNNAGNSKMVTVATNNAGRGTDIILSQDSIENGGLHVIVAFLPSNLRVQDQACGRSGRQGQPGSCEVVISTDDPQVSSIKKAISKLSEKQALQKIDQVNTVRVERLSEDRLKNSEIQKKIFKVLDSFLQSLSYIREEIGDYDPQIIGHKYHSYTSNHDNSCTNHNTVMENIYKQGSALIDHQTKGYWVEWNYFINDVKHKYATILLQKWAEFFTQIDKASNEDISYKYFDTQYNKFYESNIKNLVENPIDSFNSFVDDVVKTSASYQFCQQMNSTISYTCQDGDLLCIENYINGHEEIF